ncbi:MAG: mitochondrial fission ELM1 family protein [Alphaproteobacteria bacterium]|nr:mitochondrial fission ELM1 family protein [Alphaproteobacteria bacterium]
MTPHAWIVSEGFAGLENPALGLAAALGLEASCKRLTLPRPWRVLPPIPALARPPFFRTPATLEGPPPIVIGVGRQSIMPVIALKRRLGRDLFTIQLQDPRVSPAHFDLVISPDHDRLRGANVLTHLGSLTRITPALLAEALDALPELAALPAPRVALLIGGANKRFRFDRATAEGIADRALTLRDRGASLMVTASRRTGPENEAYLRERLSGDRIRFWDGGGANPYLAYLAAADAILVTSDSVNMVSEAASTGKPTYLIRLPGDPGKFGRFHDAMIERGHLRAFKGDLEPDWRPEPFDETARIAKEIKGLLPA